MTQISIENKVIRPVSVAIFFGTFIFILALLFVYVYPYFTDFYRICSSVRSGMTQDDVAQIMQKYNNNFTDLYIPETQITVYTLSLDNGNSCHISVRNGHVITSEADFE